MSRIVSVLSTIIIAFVFTSCGSSSSNKGNTVTEHNLNEGASSLSMTAGEIGVIHLEAVGSNLADHPGGDTDGIGRDVVTYTITTAGDHTFCFEDDDGESHRRHSQT